MLTVRLTPEGFSKPPGGVRRASIELLSALRRTGDVAVSVSPLVEAMTMTTPTPSAVDRGRMQLAEAAFFARRRLSGRKGIAHSLYYDQHRPVADWPVVVTVYDMIHERFGIGSKWLRRAKKLAVENASLIVTNSNATAADVHEFFPRLGADVITIPLGVGKEFLEEPRAPASEVESPHILYVGMRSGYKNFALLGRALATAPDLADLRLVLVGGEQLSDVELSHLGGPERVVHVASPSDEELRRLYDDAAALVITSRCEGFGLPLLEAFARGCPVACAVGGSSEELVAGFAKMFDPDSPADCAEAIRCAMSTPVALRQSAQGHARRYHWSRVAKGHIDAYRSLSNSVGAAPV